MLRNPLHLFTTTRDRMRYSRPGSHRVVVNLVTAEEALLRQSYPRLAIPTVVIGNGVDIERFAPPTAEEREAARAALGRTADERSCSSSATSSGARACRCCCRALRRSRR